MLADADAELARKRKAGGYDPVSSKARTTPKELARGYLPQGVSSNQLVEDASFVEKMADLESLMACIVLPGAMVAMVELLMRTGGLPNFCRCSSRPRGRPLKGSLDSHLIFKVIICDDTCDTNGVSEYPPIREMAEKDAGRDSSGEIREHNVFSLAYGASAKPQKKNKPFVYRCHEFEHLLLFITSLDRRLKRELLIRKHKLIAHPEGGYFREMYRGGGPAMDSKGATDKRGAIIPASATAVKKPRNTMTSIFWMATVESPILFLGENKSDHVHYYCAGEGFEYSVLYPDGRFEQVILGPDVMAGHVAQHVFPAGCYKCGRLLPSADYCLVGEAVSPGFDFKDFTFVSEEELKARETALPETTSRLEKFLHSNHLDRDFDRFYTTC